MEDLVNNKFLFKIMWANTNEIIWNMENEKPIPLNHIIYKYLEHFIDYNLWIKEYRSEYIRWISGENIDFHNIKLKLNAQMMDILPEINKKLKSKNINLFYWFDVDRSIIDEEFNWVLCPKNGELLENLNIRYNNSLVCNICFLVFPKSEQ